MDTLSVEVLQMIIEELQDFEDDRRTRLTKASRDDLHSFRLVCQSWRGAAWRAWGRFISIGPYRLVRCSLEALGEISEHREALEWVTSITIGTERFHWEAYDDIKEWVQEGRTPRTVARRRRGYHAYQKLCDEQERMDYSGEMALLLSRTFAKFQHLQKISIYSPPSTDDPILSKAIPRPRWPGCAEQKILDEAQKRVKDMYSLYAHQGAVAGVISAVVDSKILLKELRSEGGKIDAQALDIPQELLQAALPSLEHIALSLNEPTWIRKARGIVSTFTRPDGWEDWIPGFFKHAHNLQRLDLSFPALLELPASPHLGLFGNVRHTAYPEWFNGLKSIGFPSLTHLVLRQFCAGEQDLMEFIRRQSSTLTSLTLMDLTLASGGWGTLLISLGNDCNLDELIIRDPWVGLMGCESVRQHSHFKNAAKKVVVIAAGGAQVWPLDTGQAPIGTSFARDSTTIVGLG